MTSFEDPVTTVVRLLDKNMRLLQDDGGLASVYVSKEWYDQELLKNYDAQVTVTNFVRRLTVLSERRELCLMLRIMILLV